MALTSCPCPPPENGNGCSCGDHYFLQFDGGFSANEPILFASEHEEVLANNIISYNIDPSRGIKFSVDLPASQFVLHDLVTIYARINPGDLVFPFYAKLVPDGTSTKTIVIGPRL